MKGARRAAQHNKSGRDALVRSALWRHGLEWGPSPGRGPGLVPAAAPGPVRVPDPVVRVWELSILPFALSCALCCLEAVHFVVHISTFIAPTDRIDPLDPAPTLSSHQARAGPVPSLHQVAPEDAHLLQISGVHSLTSSRLPIGVMAGMGEGCLSADTFPRCPQCIDSKPPGEHWAELRRLFLGVEGGTGE